MDRDRLRAHPMEGEYRGWTQRPSLMTANALYLLAAAALVIVDVLFGALYTLPVSASMLYVLKVFLLYGCAMGWPALKLVRSAPDMRRGLRLRPPRPGLLVLAAVSAVIGAMFYANAGTLWLLLIERLGGQLSQSIAPTGAALLLATLGSALLPAMCEELLFRGALLGAWERRGTRYGLLVSSVLFAALHGSVEGFPVYLLAGLAAGYMAVCSGSVYVSMVYHAVHNLTLLYLGKGAAGTEGLYYALGGRSGVWITLVQALLFGLVYVLLLALFWQARGGAGLEQIARVDRTPMSGRELVVLLSGLVTVGAMLLIDALGIFGVL